MRPRYLIAFPLVILACCFSEAKCAAQSDMIWRVGGQYGVLGITYFKDKTEDFTMSLTLGFDKREDMTRNALANLTADNPETIVTACPLCKSTFGLYSDRPVEDIAETVDRHAK